MIEQIDEPYFSLSNDIDGNRAKKNYMTRDQLNTTLFVWMFSFLHIYYNGESKG